MKGESHVSEHAAVMRRSALVQVLEDGPGSHLTRIR